MVELCKAMLAWMVESLKGFFIPPLIVLLLLLMAIGKLQQ